MDFEIDPFYLYPVDEEVIDRLFINRDKEIELARTTLEPGFKKYKEVCAVVGGIGVGKSSFINMINKMAIDMEKKTILENDLDKVKSRSDEILKDSDVLLIDDVDKIDDEDARDFYGLCESILEDDGVIFFADTHGRDPETVKRRSFTVSQFIMLPQELTNERLSFFLEERMRRCVIDESEFVLPFTDASLKMASIRSAGNLRNFLNYAKNGWKFFKGKEGEKVTKDDMKEGIITVDTSLLSGNDLIDFKIIWYSSVGEMNRSYLAHQCDIDSKTLDRRLEGLSEIVTKKRVGKEVHIQSVYRRLDAGEEILENIFRNLGINREEF